VHPAQSRAGLLVASRPRGSADRWLVGQASAASAFERFNSVSVYFFTIRDSVRRIYDDPHGTDLPNAANALSYAEHRIIELRHEAGYGNPQLIMMVQDKDRHSVWSLPFLPACA
jgi:hypothetical protein